jgi:alpha-glucosidase
MSALVRALTAASWLIAGTAGANTLAAASPDGHTQIIFDKKDATLPTFTVSHDGKTLIAQSALGLKTDLKDFGRNGFDLIDTQTRQVDDVYSVVLGNASKVADKYTELTLTFRETGGTRKFLIIARAYDKGVAFRYVVPSQPGIDNLNISGELTSFMFPKDYNCWGLNVGKFDGAEEGEFDNFSASKLRQYGLFADPLVCKTGDDQTTIALAESDVNNYPASFFTRPQSNAYGVILKSPARPDAGSGPAYIAKVNLVGADFKTPWRVVMVGNTPYDLVDTNLIPTLATPSRIADTSWIKGGKSAWDWWNGYNAPVAHPGVNTASYLAYVDFAKSMGLNFILIDEGWYTGSSEQPRPADVTKPVADVDIPAIVRYAKDRGVRVMVWLQWRQLDRQMDDAFATYEKWGLAGVKVDFMNRSDQDMVNFYHKILAKAADHKLLVDLHGAYAPNGLLRTYPNFITQEGVMGAEYNKWSNRITATHNVTLPYTRMLLGPMDYTPGGFGNLTPDTFVARNNRPFVMTTRGQAIAMYVVYDSPLSMVADAPQAYKKDNGQWEDGVDFIQAVPTTWDESRVLAGDIGQYIVTARRKGDTWYLGAMTNEAGRTVNIPLSFLGNGQFKATIWQDAATPATLVKSTASVSSDSVLQLKLSPSGGGAAIIEKVR